MTTSDPLDGLADERRLAGPSTTLRVVGLWVAFAAVVAWSWSAFVVVFGGLFAVFLSLAILLGPWEETDAAGSGEGGS